MHVSSSFEPSEHVELAILALEQCGIGKENIAAVPMDPITATRGPIDSLRRTHEIGAFDVAAVAGTVCAVLGASFGFQWHWGPIIWGLIGLAAGASAGCGFVKMAFRKLRHKKKGANAVVILIVRCEEGDSNKIIHLVEEFSALSVGTLP